jgi:hypothetical protein
MGERSTNGSVSSHTKLQGPYNACRRADIWLESVQQDRVASYVSLLDHADSHFDDDRVVVSSPSPWHGAQLQVLRVEMFCFSSSKISIYSPFLPEPTARAVCREGGPETEFATAGT